MTEPNASRVADALADATGLRRSEPVMLAHRPAHRPLAGYFIVTYFSGK